MTCYTQLYSINIGIFFANLHTGILNRKSLHFTKMEERDPPKK